MPPGAKDQQAAAAYALQLDLSDFTQAVLVQTQDAVSKLQHARSITRRRRTTTPPPPPFPAATAAGTDATRLGPVGPALVGTRPRHRSWPPLRSGIGATRQDLSVPRGGLGPTSAIAPGPICGQGLVPPARTSRCRLGKR